jgi:hypothetical protein
VLGAPSAEGEILLIEFITEGIDVETVARSVATLAASASSVISSTSPSRCDSRTSGRTLSRWHPPMRTFLGVPVRIRDELDAAIREIRSVIFEL